MRFLLQGTVITPFEEIASGSVLVEYGRVTWVGAGEPEDRAGIERLGGDDVIVAPGFIDLQVNGFAGHDAATGVDAVRQIARRLPETGVTGFLPTIITAPLRDAANFPAVAAAPRWACPGSCHPSFPRRCATRPTFPLSPPRRARPTARERACLVPTSR